MDETDTFLFIIRTIPMIKCLRDLFEKCPRDTISFIISAVSDFQNFLKIAKFHQMSAELEKLKTLLNAHPNKMSLTLGLMTLDKMHSYMVTKLNES